VFEDILDPLSKKEYLLQDKERITKLMKFHGTDVAYTLNGVWYFDIDNKRCKLERKNNDICQKGD